jgi:hypothetical protein
MNWDVSPDGSRLGLIGLAKHYGRIEVRAISDGSWHEISAEQALGLPLSMTWAADGKSFFVTCRINDSINLLEVTLTGEVETLMRNGYRQFIGKLLSSTDGKYLAYEGDTTDSNIWTLENF